MEKIKAPLRITLDLDPLHEQQVEAAAAIEALEAENARLRDALIMMTDDYCEYMTINLLGDPETQHVIKAARAALA